MFLENRKLKKMTMSPKSNGTLYPMTQIPPAKMKLDNFAWFDYVRPLNKEDIFKWRGKGAGQELKKSTRGAAPLPNQKLFENKVCVFIYIILQVNNLQKIIVKEIKTSVAF